MSTYNRNISKKKKKILLTISFLSIFFLVFLHNIRISHAQDYEETIALPQDFMLEEFSENFGTQENITSINIELGSSRWNLTDIQLNFTNIKQERELRTIEDTPINQLTIDKFHRLAAVQINITETTEIYSVQIYGDAVNPPQNPVYIKINGYDEVLEEPDNNNYGTVEINISSTAGWYTQEFLSPVKLDPGNYSLILNGTNIGQNPFSTYRWFLNDSNPKNPDLYTWHSSGSSWDPGQKGQTLLYKLYQKTNASYFPKDIGMAVEVNGADYDIENGPEIGTGGVIIQNLMYHIGNDNLHVPIKTNAQLELNFTMNYTINLYNRFPADGSVKINTDQEIEWKVNFNLNRSDGNYTVKFSYYNSWANFTVKKNNVPLKHGVDYINNTVDKAIYILNDTVKDEIVPWEINAQSLKIDINLNPLVPEITAGTELIASVDSPLNGTYTYVLYVGISEKYRNLTSYKGGILTFSYVIPSTGPNGEWTAVLYWNNESDAGLSTQDFQVIGGTTIISLTTDGDDDTEEAGGIDPLLIFAIVLIGGIISAGSIISYVSVRRLKRTRNERRQKVTNKIRDIINLNYIMIIEKKSGLNIYEQYIAGKEIDATLISGFLEAIRAFGIELTKSFNHSQTISLEYQESKVLMSEFKNFRIILILKERPSEELLKSITALSYGIENKFGQEIKRFKGIKSQFTGMSELIEEHLNTSFISPLKVVERIDVKLTIGERAMINKAKQIMKDYNLNYIHSTFLISEQKFKASDVKIILDLINKKIFQPTTTNSVKEK